LNDRHQPVWIDHPPALALDGARLERDLDVDVAVIGAGITGLTTALLLQREGLSVAVLERHRVGRGATSHSSGHLTAALDVPWRGLVSDFGKPAARSVAQASLAAIEAIGRLSGEVGVDAGLQHLPGFRYTQDPGETGELTREAELAADLGLPVSLVRETPLPFPVAAAIRYDNQATLHPVHYVSGLARAFVAAGGALYEDTPVLEVTDGEPCRVDIAGHVVRARSVVEATHTPINVVVGLQTRLGPYMTYVLSARLAGPAPAALCWDTEDPYHYFRPLAAGSDRLIAGGCDHKTGQPGHGNGGETDPFHALEQHVRARFDVQEVEQRWSFEVFEPADGLPYAGRLGGGHVYVATGLSGTGLTFGTLCAHLLADLIAGRDHPLAKLLSPSRLKPVASARDVVRENANVAWHMVRDRLKGPDVATAASIAPGEGRIVELDGNRAAVYRNAQGALSVMSPVCTHMGCIVGWNASAATWDCPCHGGRYLPGGEVLSGPPTRGLSEPAP